MSALRDVKSILKAVFPLSKGRPFPGDRPHWAMKKVSVAPCSCACTHIHMFYAVRLRRIMLCLSGTRTRKHQHTKPHAPTYTHPHTYTCLLPKGSVESSPSFAKTHTHTPTHARTHTHTHIHAHTHVHAPEDKPIIRTMLLLARNTQADTMSYPHPQPQAPIHAHTRAPRRKNPPNNTLVCARLNLYIRDIDDDTNTDTHEDNAQYGLLYCPTSQPTTENVTSQADYALVCQRHASTHIRTCTHAHMHMCVHKHV